MSRRRSQEGFGLLETVVVAVLAVILLTMGMSSWRGHVAQQRLRYGAAQVASDLRLAHERAKAERTPYTVSFSASSGSYAIARTSGGFLENAVLPDGVTVAETLVITFSAFGTPGAECTLTVGNAAGTATVTVSEAGGVIYQEN